MRISPRLAALSAAAAITAVGAVAGAVTANAATAPKCDKAGVCFTVTSKPLSSTKIITVTGTAGSDSIVLSNKAAFGNNSLSHVAVNGIDTQVDATFNAQIVVNALAGNDQISMPTLSGTNGFVLYGSATLDGGDGNDAIAGANRADVLVGGKGTDVLDGGAGNDQLNALDGQQDTVHGGLGTDTAKADAVDKVDGVEASG